jgi:hypothetical protein
MKCEDYPCCGHTDQDPCERQWYDDGPPAFTLFLMHTMCDHENNICEVDGPDDDDFDNDDYDGDEANYWGSDDEYADD